jgi:hypothetical protein
MGGVIACPRGAAAIWLRLNVAGIEKPSKESQLRQLVVGPQVLARAIAAAQLHERDPLLAGEVRQRFGDWRQWRRHYRLNVLFIRHHSVSIVAGQAA